MISACFARITVDRMSCGKVKIIIGDIGRSDGIEVSSIGDDAFTQSAKLIEFSGVIGLDKIISVKEKRWHCYSVINDDHWIYEELDGSVCNEKIEPEPIKSREVLSGISELEVG